MFAAFMLSGDVKFGKDALIWQVYTGKALGAYGTGFQQAYFNDAEQDIVGLESMGWLLGYTHNWTDAVRSNIVLSGVEFKDDSAITATNSTDGTALKTGLYAAVNTFVMLTKNLQFGVEYVYEKAEAFGDAPVWTDIDGQGTNDQSNSKIHLALKANF